MRQKISYDSSDYTGSVIIWIIIIGIICFFWWWPTPAPSETVNNASTYSGGWWWWFWVLAAILFFWWIAILCFAPLDVSADDDYVEIRRPLKTKRIRMDEIESAQPYDISRNASKKAFRSSPIRSFGHWGQYSDDKIGDYFAYYGKPENTVLIKLKNGQQYVVGGSDAKQLSEYINSKKK